MMTTDALPHVHYHGNSHRPPRALCFLLGCLVGIAVTAGADGMYIKLSRMSAPEWNTSLLVCMARSETGYSVRNSGPNDYHLTDAREFILMQVTTLGLVASDVKLRLPVFIPQGEVAEILVNPLPGGAIVLFDLGRRYKVTLK
jgi:hypothetical protein